MVNSPECRVESTDAIFKPTKVKVRV